MIQEIGQSLHLWWKAIHITTRNKQSDNLYIFKYRPLMEKFQTASLRMDWETVVGISHYFKETKKSLMVHASNVTPITDSSPHMQIVNPTILLVHRDVQATARNFNLSF